MIFKKTQSDPTELDNALTDLFKEMEDISGGSEEYAAMAAQVERLYKLKEVDVKVDSGRKVSPETKAVIAANIAGILLIVGHERANVITSKALSLLAKLR